MDKLLTWIGALAGAVGVVMCLSALVTRFMGSYWLAGVQVGTVLMGSIAMMSIGSLCFLAVLVLRPPPRG